MTERSRSVDEAARLIRSGRPAEAVPLLAQSVLHAREIGHAHALYLEALILSGDRRRALDTLRGAMSLPVRTADALDALAFFALKLDQFQISNDLYRQAAELAPGEARLWYNLASSERTLGKLASAAECCKRALMLDPAMRPAIHLRSEVTRATTAANNIVDLRERLKSAAEDSSRTYLFYALGKELHDLGLYSEAFEAFAQGASARRRTLRYDVAQDEQKLRRIAEAFPRAAIQQQQRGEPGKQIFIIGLPRSGTTLTERILGGLEGVRSNNETNNFSTALMRHAASSGRDVFDRASRADFSAVAREYAALSGMDDFDGSVIEKLPFNYLYVGPILQAFPNASIIWVRRNPIDSCFAMFRTLFMDAYPFSYSFPELARYYSAYSMLMSHWQALYGDRLTVIRYETLVSNPHAVGPQLAARCGLPWKNQALDIAANTSASLTASAAQIRQGIYTTSSGIWKKYSNHLAPLAQHLRDAGVAIDTDLA